MKRIAVMCLLVSAVLTSLAAAGDVVGWRTDGTGKYPDADPPTKWSATETIVWKTPMPSWSNSTPIIVGDRLFVCSEQTTLLCLRLSDGKILWQKDHPLVDAFPPEEMAKARAEMKRIGVDSVKQRIKALKKEMGQVQKSLRKDPKNAQLKSKIEEFKKQIQEQDKKLDPVKKYMIPPCHAVVITPGGDFFRMDDGKKIGGRTVSLQFNQPLVDDGVVYFVQHGGKAYKLPPHASESLELSPLWTTKPQKDRYYASPVVHDGLVYAITQKHIFSAIDAKTGEVVYEENLKLGKGQAYPSIALAGKYLFVSGMSGTTAIIQPGREFKEVARNSLEEFRSCPVFAGKRMYIRTTKHVYCVGK